mmetsp:Transcript_17519/g.36247  ORF Transcript_17519/g.36247 Transcript_17519/m.36247 type:complete len:581 (+) Transcript_17519:293-2035(+)
MADDSSEVALVQTITTSLISDFVERQKDDIREINVPTGRRISKRNASKKNREAHLSFKGHPNSTTLQSTAPPPQRKRASKDPNAPKRKRGRPRKQPQPEVVTHSASVQGSAPSSEFLNPLINYTNDARPTSSTPAHQYPAYTQDVDGGSYGASYPIYVTAGSEPPTNSTTILPENTTTSSSTHYTNFTSSLPTLPPTISTKNGLTFDQFVRADGILPPTHLLNKPATPSGITIKVESSNNPVIEDTNATTCTAPNENGENATGKVGGATSSVTALHVSQQPSGADAENEISRVKVESIGDALFNPQMQENNKSSSNTTSTSSKGLTDLYSNINNMTTIGGYQPPPISTRNDVPPHDWLMDIFKQRGYCTKSFCSLDTSYYAKPTEVQQASYGLKLVQLCRTDELEECKKYMECGLSYNPCNRFGESIIHMACRRGNTELVKYLLDRGCNVQICDDFGRTPLHDACWTNEPKFELVELLLEKDLRLLNITDCRGATPLAYVKRENWSKWKSFFTGKVEKYWAPRDVEKDGEESVPALALFPPCSRVLEEPENVLPVDIAKQLSGGTVTPSEVKNAIAGKSI